MRKALLVVGALGLVGGLAMPATAAETETTFTLTAGATGLSISAPATGTLGSVALGSDPSADLGPVTVDDQRGTLLGSWTASVSSTDFVTGDPASATNLTERTIGAANVTYNAGLLTEATTTGTGVFMPAALPVTLEALRTAFTGTGLVGVNSATWTPTITVNVPAAAVAGTYTGTITHSVA